MDQNAMYRLQSVFYLVVYFSRGRMTVFYPMAVAGKSGCFATAVLELTTAAQLACRLLFQECYKVGIKDIFITETYRSLERQKYLYAQGRIRPG